DHEILCQIVRIADAMCLNLGIGLRIPLDLSKIGFEQIGLTSGKFSELQEKLKRMYMEQKAQMLE
ncbi:MAG: hypothetical protein HY099_04305, partial [Nitrospirae bacterium]|nr:hypothetical protein [Nitrospirota bacterium]